ncbi:Deleted in malignant brain tumors 1 protein [Geodia barretti]|uniref:Deleted in malignant brain tumors 1 protein n=1 Tax=Geodia barretti TaxID=519541 RepID=A0AA35SP11_GEOBA|nr:Deleted in malignant brain tumors 1 protein [Geodia barretti]
MGRSDLLRSCLPVPPVPVQSSARLSVDRTKTAPSLSRHLPLRVPTRTTLECSVRRPRGLQLSVPPETLDWPVAVQPREGRVEICINNQWGTICDDSWDERGVNLVCSALYNEQIVGEMVDPEEFSGVEDLPILMDDVKCRGMESNLLSCPQLQLNASHDCTHMEDVAISCTGTRRCQNGEIALAGGQYVSEGTIQICLDGVWGTVCDDLWDPTDAGVVCNILGYTNGSAIALRGAHFGQGTGPIHLDNVICTGSETSLLDCRSSPHNCGHYEDAGVICPAPQDADANCTNGDIRLADGDNEYQGRVEVCLHGNWGTVCDDGWDNRDAGVVCNQLGYTGGFPSAVSNAGFGRGSGLIFLDNVDCDGTEPNLLQCRGNEPGNHNCGPSEDAGVFCPDPTANCSNGDVRLAGGTTEYEGRVEVCIGGAWGTVCGDSLWDDREASVVCRQLGLPNKYSIAVGDAAFGPGEGLVLIRSMQCNGSESALLNCRYSTPSPFSFFCRSHSSDASVVCHGKD